MNSQHTARPAAWLLLLLLLGLLTGRGAAQTSLSLPELQALAADNALGVLVAQQQLTNDELALTAFNASLKPRLDLNANFPNYFRTSTEVTQDDGTVAFREIELNNSFVGLRAQQRLAATGGLLALESRLQRTDNLSLGNQRYNGNPLRLIFRQPILAFNPLKWDRELLPLARRVSERELTAARAAAVTDATRLFFDLVSADQESRIATTNKTANDQLYRVAEERYKLGKISRGDLVQLQLERTSAAQNLLRAQRLVAAASAAIQNQLGRQYDGIYYVPTLPVPTAVADLDRKAAIDQMLARRPELLAARADVRRAERNVDQVRRDFGPRIDVEAGFGLVRNDTELAPIYRDPRDERLLSVNLSLPILDWGERRARRRQAESQRELAGEVARRSELDLRGELAQLLEQWRTVREELDLAAEIRDLADERFRIAQESYRLGAIPLPELSLAQQFRDQNVRGYARTLRAYWLTYARLSELTLSDTTPSAILE